MPSTQVLPTSGVDHFQSGRKSPFGSGELVGRPALRAVDISHHRYGKSSGELVEQSGEGGNAFDGPGDNDHPGVGARVC